MSDVLYSTDGEIFQYDSVEELMLTEDLDDYEVGSVIYEGELYELSSNWINAENVIDLIDEQWYEECGEENDPFEPSKEAIEELEAFLQQWQEKYAVPPFKGIKNVLPYHITQEDIARAKGGDNDEA
jgi:hypothetical protein